MKRSNAGEVIFTYRTWPASVAGADAAVGEEPDGQQAEQDGMSHA